MRTSTTGKIVSPGFGRLLLKHPFTFGALLPHIKSLPDQYCYTWLLRGLYKRFADRLYKRFIQTVYMNGRALLFKIFRGKNKKSLTV
jgi:hypothetical protein